MAAKSEEKREYILTCARKVFIRKGFTAVNMSDIVKECGVSRGGVYLYFKSVDEIFVQVIIMHNRQKLEEARGYLAPGKSFSQVLEEFFHRQKKRLLNMSGSLLMAMYEFRFAHKDDFDRGFFYTQFMNTKTIILEILSYGVEKGDISPDNIDELAMSVMFFIEGISMLGTSAGVSEELIDNQINIIKKLVYSH